MVIVSCLYLKVYGKLLGRDGDDVRWLTWTPIPGSVWPIVSHLYITEKKYKALTYLCYSLETSDVEVRQYSLAIGFFTP